MSLHLPTLALVVCVVILTTTVIMTLVGLTQRRAAHERGQPRQGSEPPAPHSGVKSSPMSAAGALWVRRPTDT